MPLLIAAAAVAAVPLTGCESTQDKSARLARKGGTLLHGEKGLVVSAQSRDVRVAETTVIQDENGTAVVVVLRNRSAQPVGAVPLAIDVQGGGGGSVYKNDTPGLDPSLVEATGLPAHGEVAWVDDQVTASGAAKRVAARVGVAKGSAPRALPQIALGTPQLQEGDVTGPEAVGLVTNRSQVEQKRLVVFCVARRGGKLVAAGRAIVNRLAPGKHARYHVFFIGNPRGASLSAVAPPTVLE